MKNQFSTRSRAAASQRGQASADSPQHKLGLYIRVSTEEQAQNPEGSIKNQEENLRAVIKVKNMDKPFGEVAGVYIDRGLSGKDTNRPELQRLLSAIRRREITLLMVFELSRLSRSIKDFADIWGLMQESGCGLYSIRESFDTTTAAGEMVLFMMANLAQFERRQISERVMANIQARAERGLYNGGMVPLGYRLIAERKGYLEIDPDTAAVVKTAFRAFLKERSLTATALWLNTQGHRVKRTTQGGGDQPRLGHFTVSNLHCILRNPAYVGVKRYQNQGQWQESKAVWEPIIEEGLFDQAQELLSRNFCRYKPDSPDRYPFILSGVIQCGKCGERLSGKTATGKKGRYPYYEHAWLTKRQACLASKVLTCHPRRVLASRLEPAVWDAVLEVLKDSRIAQGIIAEAQATHARLSQSSEAKRIRDKMSSLAGQLEALSEHLAQLPKGVPATPIFKQMEKIETIRAAEEVRLKEVESQAENSGQGRGLPASSDLYEQFVASLRQLAEGPLGPPLKARIIALLVAKIEILPESFRLHFRVGENKITRELAQNAGSRLFLCPGIDGEGENLGISEDGGRKTGKKEGPGKNSQALITFFEKKCSNSLQNGVPGRSRTCDLRLRRPSLYPTELRVRITTGRKPGCSTPLGGSPRVWNGAPRQLPHQTPKRRTEANLTHRKPWRSPRAQSGRSGAGTS